MFLLNQVNSVNCCSWSDTLLLNKNKISEDERVEVQVLNICKYFHYSQRSELQVKEFPKKSAEFHYLKGE